MSHAFDRRQFLAAGAALGAAALLPRSTNAQQFKTTLKKSMIGGPSPQTLESLKKAGFDGIESTNWNIEPEQAAEARKQAEGADMQIHSVLFGWANFNTPSVDGDVANVERALRACQGYGSTALLLVPCRIGGMAMPQPWEFEIEFDPATNHIQKVVAGDNEPYKQYIEAHNHAADTSRKAVERLIPTAEKTGVVIALENVWNNLWVKPAVFQNFVASFGSPWVKAYFDIGNHVKYAMPELWIRALGDLIVKCHVKDFKLNADGHGGDFCNIRDGSIDWPVVRRALDEVGYNGFMTIEGGNLSLEEHGQRLDLIVAGK